MNNDDNRQQTSSNEQGQQNTAKRSNKIKDPADWTTGDEPMTGAQQSYIQTLSGGQADMKMTKAEAAQYIDEHKNRQQGRGSQEGGSSNAIKDPENWATGGEEMTDAQRSYLKTLADEAGENVDENLSKAEASKHIDELQQKTGRGAG
jgi:hypothetical protein